MREYLESCESVLAAQQTTQDGLSAAEAKERLEKIGPNFENLAIFPDRVNTEFVRVIDSKTLQMRVWERGSGETYACGTGACATVVAAVLNGICPMDTPITVRLRGGDLKIVCESDMRVLMTGPAQKSYEGVFDYEDSDQ